VVEPGGGVTTTVLREEPQADSARQGNARQARMTRAAGRMANLLGNKSPGERMPDPLSCRN
jgi:hypothetical protein